MGRLHFYMDYQNLKPVKRNGKKLPSDDIMEFCRRKSRALMLEAIRSGNLQVPEEYLQRLLEG